MNIAKLFGGRSDPRRPISSNRHKKLGYIRQGLAARLGEAAAGRILRDADRKYLALTRRYADLPEAVRQHTTLIFLNAAVYLSACERLPRQEAYQVMEEATVKYARPIGRLLDRATRMPGMPKLFLKLFAKMVDGSYNEAAGFKVAYHRRTGGELSFDITACPYQKYFTLAGCPELCKGACLSDDECYGRLKRIEFGRTQTLGRGGQRCDFRFRLK